MDQIKIGKFISLKRKENNITQLQLAELLGVTDRAVSKWENGICMPDVGIMGELCKILNITINDLFSGEKVNMKNNEKVLEEHLLEMTKMKEESDKKLLTLEIVLGVICLIPLFAAIIIVNIASLDNWVKTLIVITGCIPLLVSTPFAIAIEQKAGYYECGKCHHKYIPTYKQVFLAPHINRTRYMKCPSCNQNSWNKKVISKKD